MTHELVHDGLAGGAVPRDSSLGGLRHRSTEQCPPLVLRRGFVLDQQLPGPRGDLHRIGVTTTVGGGVEKVVCRVVWLSL